VVVVVVVVVIEFVVCSDDAAGRSLRIVEVVVLIVVVSLPRGAYKGKLPAVKSSSAIRQTISRLGDVEVFLHTKDLLSMCYYVVVFIVL
jgi:hypothetical protein